MTLKGFNETHVATLWVHCKFNQGQIPRYHQQSRPDILDIIHNQGAHGIAHNQGHKHLISSSTIKPTNTQCHPQSGPQTPDITHNLADKHLISPTIKMTNTWYHPPSRRQTPDITHHQADKHLISPTIKTTNIWYHPPSRWQTPVITHHQDYKHLISPTIKPTNTWYHP